MDTPLVETPNAPRPVGRKPLTALRQWTVATLAALIVLLIYLQVGIVGQFSPPLALVLGLPAVVVAVLLLTTRWRWAPLLAVLYWLLLLAVNVRYIRHDLAHPEFFNTFAFTVILLGLAVVGLVAGVGATIQHYRAPTAAETDHGRRRVPAWFRPVPWSLAGLCLGALLVGALPRATPGATVSAETLAILPTLTAAQIRFAPTELRVKAGEIVALHLENRDTTPHSFNIDEFNVHISMPSGESSVALFKAGTPGTYTFYCDIPGHRAAGMVGTLIVEPLTTRLNMTDSASISTKGRFTRRVPLGFRYALAGPISARGPGQCPRWCCCCWSGSKQNRC